MFPDYPYTDGHQLNLDWLVTNLTELKEALDTGQLVGPTGENGESAFIDSIVMQYAFVPYNTTPLPSVWFNTVGLAEAAYSGDIAGAILCTKIRVNCHTGDTYYSHVVHSRTYQGKDGTVDYSELATEITDWLEENITQETGYVIDSSLTVAGAAADAKAVGDALNYKADNVYGDSPAPTALPLEAGKAWNQNSGAYVTQSTRAASNVISKTNDMIELSVASGYQLYVFGNNLGQGNPLTAVSTAWADSLSISDANYDYLYVNIRRTDNTDITTDDLTNVLTVSKLGEILPYALEQDLNSLERAFNNFKSASETINKIVHYTENINSFWSIQTTPVSAQAYTGYYVRLDPIPVEYGEIYDLYFTVGTSAKQRAWVLVDEDYNLLSSAETTTQGYHSYTVEINDVNAEYLLITELGKASEYISITRRVANTPNPFRGLKLSLLGDSISAFSGTIPTGNLSYYNGTNSGVPRASDMWWYKVCQILGMNPLVINGWSGSCVTSGVRDSAVYKPASDTSRCQALNVDSENPDVVLIAMGLNDYSYNAPIGTWDGTSALSNDTTTFRTAYATMISRIQTAYPNALIVCITPWFMQRGTDAGVTYINGNGLTETAFSDAIKDIANIMNCPVIDGTSIGFNRHNYYPTFCEDSAVIPTHPNANGQDVMGVTIAEELTKMCGGFIEYIN